VAHAPGVPCRHSAGTGELRSPPQANAYATKPGTASRQAAYEAAAGCEPAPQQGQCPGASEARLCRQEYRHGTPGACATRAVPLKWPIEKYPLGTGAGGASGIAKREVNGDGLLDIVTCNASASNISVLLNDGKGSFQSAQVFPTGGQPESDAIATGHNVNVLYVALGGGTGSLTPAASFQAGHPLGAVAGSFSGGKTPAIAYGVSDSVGVISW